MTFPDDKTKTTAPTLTTGTALPQVETLYDRGDGAYSANVACADPTGTTRALTIEFTWVEALPGIDIENATLDGDTEAGMALVARNADALRRVLARAVRDARTSAA